MARHPIFWITLIVILELISFTLLQKSLESEKNKAAYIVISVILFSLVPLAFRESLRGSQIAVANLYWILLSQIGSIILGYAIFNQKFGSRETFSVVLLIIAALVTLNA
jgi:multidrug transporter EmrE-like cation transporter